MNAKPRKKIKRKSKQSKSLELKEDQIDFDSFFWFQTQNGRLRNIQHTEVKVFFKQKGLKDKETKSRFEEVLKLY